MINLLAQEAASISSWEKHGLAGLVIGALFFALLFVARWMLEHIDKANAQYQAERKEFLNTIDGIATRHYEERREWRAEAAAQNAKVAAAIASFTEVLSQVQREYTLGLVSRSKAE